MRKATMMMMMMMMMIVCKLRGHCLALSPNPRELVCLLNITTPALSVPLIPSQHGFN